MKNKIKYTAIAVIAFAAITAILLHNRSQIKAEENVEKITAYPVNVDTVTFKHLNRSLKSRRDD